MIEPLGFRLLYAALLITFVAHRAYYTRRLPPPESQTLSRSSGASLRSRLAAGTAALALVASLVYLISPASLSFAFLGLPAVVRLLGVLIAGCGYVLLELSHRALASNWSDRPRITQSQELVRSGPYGRIRHPIYTSFFLILGSSLLITSNWVVGLLWIVMVGLDSSARIQFEESAMESRFGQPYLDYKARTGRLTPWL